MDDFSKKIDEINKRIDAIVKAGERDIARKYAKLLTDLRRLLAKQYEKYDQDGKLTIREMVKFDRLKKLEKEIQTLLKLHYQDLSKTMPTILGDTYTQGYEQTAWAVETSAMAMLNYSTATPEQLTAMINNPVSGLTLNRILERNRQNIIFDIQQQVTQGLVKGETYSSMAKRLLNSLNGDATKAMRIVRTEGHRAQEQSKFDAVDYANANGVVMVKEWNTMEDSRVRHGIGKNRADHRKLDHKKLPMDGNFDDGLSKGKAPGLLGAAGSDINCRCLLTYTIEKVERPQYPGLAEMPFDEWKKERLINKNPPPKPKEKPKAAPKPKKEEKPKEKPNPEVKPLAKMKKATDASIKRFDELVSGITIEKTSDNRRKYAVKLLENAGLGDLKVSERKNLTAKGVVTMRINNLTKTITAMKYELLKADYNKDDKYKTLFHEFYHANYNGLKCDYYDIGRSKWTQIEETMTETAGHYMNIRAGNQKSILSYGEYLATTLPVLKHLEEFKGASSIYDFGEIAMKYRFDDEHKTAEWGWLYNKVDAKSKEIKFDFRKYVKDNYLGFINENLDRITDYALDGMETTNRWHNNKEQLKKYIQEEIKGFLESNSSTPNYGIKSAMMFSFFEKGVL